MSSSALRRGTATISNGRYFEVERAGSQWRLIQGEAFGELSSRPLDVAWKCAAVQIAAHDRSVVCGMRDAEARNVHARDSILSQRRRRTSLSTRTVSSTRATRRDRQRARSGSQRFAARMASDPRGEAFPQARRTLSERAAGAHECWSSRRPGGHRSVRWTAGARVDATACW